MKILLPAATALLLAPASLAAQQQPATNEIVAIPPSGGETGEAAREGAVGPESLRDFSLDPADRAPARPQASPPASPGTPAPPPSVAPSPRPVEPAPSRPTAPPPGAAPTAASAAPPVAASGSEATPSASASTRSQEAARTLVATEPTAPSVAIAPRAPAPELEEEATNLKGWLLALVPVIVTIGAFLLIARRRKARGGSGQLGPTKVAQEARPPLPASPPAHASARPAPARPAPSPPAPDRPDPAPAPSGLVTTTLKPDLQVAVAPLRCAIDEEELWLDYRIDLVNRGTGAAHAVHFDVAMLNAGPEQAQQIAEFAAHPQATGRAAPVPLLAPGQGRSLTGRAALPLASAKVYVIEERPLLMPILVVAPRRAAGQANPAIIGEPAVAYMVGRSGGSGGRLAPIRADVRPKLIRDAALKPL
ncbi:hypothetical protein [Sphingomicrobium astaxanthinifaciens]|uniref:hypothetical protein n=1 Tax=Sphingomicrobium astaxanthinifaciens TaxID=1227949 RepID=UPI001FCB8648|nr:hypothetical protein [Sphingomicrobium astaxanthinifaciens]MCJ7421553.1 hypothetical protein [Sphingomicrobium astaxanthinifaciens]